MALVLPAAFGQGDLIAYIGTYTRQNSKGIYAWRFQPSTGKLTSIGLAGETSNPSFLAVHPNQKFLYAVNENGQGTVTAFSIDPATGNLTMLNQVSSHGNGPCHVALDKSGKWLFIANYGSGSIAAYPVGADGKLGEASATVQHKGSSVVPSRQRGPHAHSANLSPDGKFLLVTDLGLDQVLTYKLDPAKGSLDPGDPPFTKTAPGVGPRHLAFHPNGKFAYVCNEIVSTVTAFGYNAANGSLQELQSVSLLPKDVTVANNSAAEIAVHPNGSLSNVAVHFTAGSNLRQDLPRNRKRSQQLVIPFQSFHIHQLRAAGIGYVGSMQAVFPWPCQLPQQKLINISEQKFSGFSLASGSGDVFQQPA